MKAKLILLNGAPRSGKDTGADYLVQAYDAVAFKFSGPIKAAIKAAFDLSDEQVAYLESVKGEPDDLLFGHSYRNVQISFSENWMKVVFGDKVFGHLAARKTSNLRAPLLVCSDSGFASEAAPVLDTVGRDNTLLVKVHRPGKTFAGDSRSFIELDGVKTVDIHNDGTLADYYIKLHHVVSGFLESEA
jgi:hypothetical protein